ncbi:MAG TPA: hypothetical protein PLP58_18355, partial [Prosthecobacter sp.]|nr:hypothetical protein [Prosthecobacter sp.]
VTHVPGQSVTHLPGPNRPGCKHASRPNPPAKLGQRSFPQVAKGAVRDAYKEFTPLRGKPALPSEIVTVA